MTPKVCRSRLQKWNWGPVPSVEITLPVYIMTRGIAGSQETLCGEWLGLSWFCDRYNVLPNIFLRSNQKGSACRLPTSSLPQKIYLSYNTRWRNAKLNNILDGESPKRDGKDIPWDPFKALHCHRVLENRKRWKSSPTELFAKTEVYLSLCIVAEWLFVGKCVVQILSNYLRQGH